MPFIARFRSPPSLPATFYEVAQQASLRQGWQVDSAQQAAWQAISRWTDHTFPFQSTGHWPPWSVFTAFRNFFTTGERTSRPQGYYLWGPVGRGKSYTVDEWVAYLREVYPALRVRRLHFHHLMRDLHQALHQFSGLQDPLGVWMQEHWRDVHVLCVDELYINDIADAMLWARLFERGLSQGLYWAITANQPPSGLYPNGLSRHLFLPTIRRLESRLLALTLDGPTDYRTQYWQDQACMTVLKASEFPQGESDQILGRFFAHLTHKQASLLPGSVWVNQQSVATRAHDQGVLWCDFPALCAQPKHYGDYAELARLYHTVLIGLVPQLNAAQDDQARRFIALVDEFYDQRVKLILTLLVPIDRLYQGSALAWDWQRTHSRLQEMQTSRFWSQPHRR